MAEPVIIVDNLHKSFKLPHERHNSLKQAALNIFKGASYEELKTLNGISFEVRPGEFFGIVGRNGSGKSTLLKTMAGIYTPTSGKVHINGRLTPFIELGVGFNPELSGRDNVYLNGAIFGMTRPQVEAAYDTIVEFAELEKFMDQKLKNYSSGMQVRLAFSIAVRAQSEILLLDEVLAVGDATFQQKCFNYFKELKKQGKTVILVSHDSNALQEYCDRGVLIADGKIVKTGSIDAVIKRYMSMLNELDNTTKAAPGVTEAPKKRWGRGGIEIKSGATMAGASKKTVFTDENEIITVSVTYASAEEIEAPVYGITITDAGGSRIFQSNTLWSKVTTRTVAAGAEVTVSWDVPNIFSTGDFFVAPAVADRSGVTIYDWYDDFMKFKVRKQLQTSAHANVKHTITVQQS